ncbi:MAG: pilus assembly protein PilM [Candidatus Saccharimonadaceae bacterium]|nr:pilus assembly protein PilM [Candidatus Saccharimonadaceae bacterium]
MSLLHGVGDFFSLDIGTKSMRIVRLTGGSQRGWSLQNYSYTAITPQLAQDSSEAGRARLGEAIVQAVNQAGIKTKNIAMGIPANKSYTSIIETDSLPEKELAKSFKYELDKYVPMPLSEAKADYLVLGPSPNDPRKTEILVSSVSKEYAESTMEMVEKVGFNIIAMEPEPLAMARALNTPGSMNATMIVDFGEGATDIVIMYKDKPRLVRSIPGGMDVLVRSVANGLSVREDQARQFILKYGLDQSQVEGRVFSVLSAHLEGYAAELIKSARFFQTKYLGASIGGVVLSNYASMIPLFPEYVGTKTNMSTMRGDPWQFVRMSASQQQALAGVSNEFAVVIGLSERSND